MTQANSGRPQDEEGEGSASAYEPPVLHEIGSVYELTLARGPRCFWGKKWGGSDGLEFMGITVPVSSC